MKYFAILVGLLTIQSTNAANIKFFENTAASEVQFTVITLNSIEKFEYDESDKELTVWFKNSKFQDFEVDSLKQAEEIITKVLDTNDNTFVTLTKS